MLQTEAAKLFAAAMHARVSRHEPRRQVRDERFRVGLGGRLRVAAVAQVAGATEVADAQSATPSTLVRRFGRALKQAAQMAAQDAAYLDAQLAARKRFSWIFNLPTSRQLDVFTALERYG